jgi:hypothetical protein
MILSLLFCAHHAIVLGNNMPAPDSTGLPTLRYADDDAATFAEWLTGIGADVTLLAVPDRRTQERFPELAARAMPPSRAALTRAVAAVKTHIHEERSRGEKTVLWLYFSGHGHAGSQPKLALTDGGLTQPELYAALEDIGADLAHVVVDACHAEAIVRPRGASTLAPLNEEDAARFVAQRTLAALPHTGAIIAATADQLSHEWDGFEGGVFTHELLSALRGAADVNGDGRIEYSEAYAFLVAANREVSDARARLSVVVAAPIANERSVLAELSSPALIVDEGAPRRLWIEDTRGVRLADVHREEKHRLRLALPAERDLFVRTAAGDARLRLRAKDSVKASELRFLPQTTQSRGALSDALERGLFALAYGPTYYRGFVDSAGMLGVRFEEPAATTHADPTRRRAATALWITAGVTTAAALVFGGLALAAADRYSVALTDPAAAAERRHFEGFGAGFIAGAGLSVGLAAAGFFVFPF